MNSKTFFQEFGKSIYHIDAIYAEFAKKSGVTPTLLWILYAINDERKHTQREICFDWSLPKSTVNTLIMELKEKEYLTLEPIKGKRREMNIIITKSGREYANHILKELYLMEEEVFSKLNFDVPSFLSNLNQFEAMLNKIGDESK